MTTIVSKNEIYTSFPVSVYKKLSVAGIVATSTYHTLTFISMFSLLRTRLNRSIYVSMRRKGERRKTQRLPTSHAYT
jgi:hypothetical protein